MQDLFSDKDWAFLENFPYQVGIWMSSQDKGGGEAALKKERYALSEAVIRIQSKYDNSKLLKELLKSNRQEANGQDVSEGIVKGAKRVRDLLQILDNEVERHFYKLACIDVAEAVARASGDRPLGAHNLYGGPEKGWFGLYPFLSKIVRLGRGPRVSQAEKDAINLLIDALGAEKLVEKWKPWTPVKNQSKAS